MKKRRNSAASSARELEPKWKLLIHLFEAVFGVIAGMMLWICIRAAVDQQYGAVIIAAAIAAFCACMFLQLYRAEKAADPGRINPILRGCMSLLGRLY